jgi:general secretion pathway protein D
MLGLIKNIIDTADKPRAEVLVEVTILEVSRTRLKDLGIDLSAYAIGLSFSPEFAPAQIPTTPAVPINLANMGTPSRANTYATIPSAIIKILESDQKTRLLAKPQLRGREGTPLTLNLGDEIPVATTSFLAIATGGVQNQPQTSYNYRPIGVNLSLTPKVTYQDEIILDPLIVDKSGVGPNIDVAGVSLPTFSKRTASVAMRLRDGESNLLAGLIREEDRETAKSIPGINRIPILRAIFGNVSGTVEQSDIIMIVTPHIIRSREITADDLKPFYVGTANNLGAATAAGLISQAPPPAAGQAGQAGQAGAGQGGQVVVTTPPPTAPPPVTRAPGVVAVAPVTAADKDPTSAQLLMTVPTADLQLGGPPYTVPVTVTGVSQLGAITLTISYDPKVLKATSASPGTFMQQGGITPAFVPKIDEATGRIDIAVSRGGTAPGAAGTGLLAGIVFQTVGAGTTRISITGTALTPDGKAIPLQLPPAASVIVK